MKLGQTVLRLILSCALGSLAGLAVPVTSHSQDIIEGAKKGGQVSFVHLVDPPGNR